MKKIVTRQRVAVAAMNNAEGQPFCLETVPDTDLVDELRRRGWKGNITKTDTRVL